MFQTDIDHHNTKRKICTLLNILTVRGVGPVQQRIEWRGTNLSHRLLALLSRFTKFMGLYGKLQARVG